MKKVWIYMSIIIVLILAVFYIKTDKKKSIDTDTNVSQEEANKEEAKEKNNNDNQKTEDSSINPLEAGKPLPDFTLKNLAGEDIILSEIKDKMIFINFWATWCTWCDKEMPDIQKIKEENEDLVVLAINVDETEEEVREYMEKGGYDFEVLLDKEGKISAEYLVTGLPTSFFVDKDGNLVGRAPGALDYEKINEVLNNIREE